MKKTLLLVDDEQPILRSLNRFLSLEGYDVITANSGMEGLEILDETHVPVIISDERMPYMSGSEFLAQAKTMHPDAIRMVLSGYADFDALASAINNGNIYKFLTKPWNETALLEEISGAFKYYEQLTQQSHADHLIKNAIEAVVITNPDGKIQSVNTTFCLLTEHDAKSIIGQKLSIIDPEKELISTIDEIQSHLEEFGVWQGELWLKTRTWKSFAAYMSVTAIKNERGGIENYTYSFIDITQKLEQANLLEYKNTHDELTGLINRDCFSERLSRYVHESQEKKFPIITIFIDLDRFKYINNVLGHKIGDMAIKAVAKRLKIWGIQGELIARLGNDEFAILYADLSDNLDVDEYLTKLHAVFDKPFTIARHELHIMASIGISIYPYDGKNASELMQHANTALNYASQQGLGHYQRYDANMMTDTKNKLLLENDVRNAINREQFTLHYQPIVDITNNKVNCVEALVRWQHPEYGIIMPNEFIPLCEETGIIVHLEKLTLALGVKTLKNWHESLNLDMSININLSAKEFTQPNLLSFIDEMIERSGIEPQYLTLELTESLVLNDIKQSEQLLFELHEKGLKLALDDFGTGYSSLHYLTHLPFDIVKIDQSFTRNMLTNKKAQTIMFSILDLCQNLSIKTVVEGVETEEQRDYLMNLPCDCIQGYLIARPLAEKELLNFIERKGA